MTSAITSQPTNSLARLTAVADQAKDYARQSKASSTCRPYPADWPDLERWCSEQGLGPMQAALYREHAAAAVGL